VPTVPAHPVGALSSNLKPPTPSDARSRAPFGRTLGGCVAVGERRGPVEVIEWV